MTPRPTSIALTFCGRVIIDQSTNMRSLIDILTGIAVNEFPSEQQQFYVHVALTGAVGSGTIELRAIRMATGERIYSQRGNISFPDRTDVVSPFFHVRSVQFPEPGFYLFQILLDDEVIDGTARRLRVYKHE